MAARHVSFNEKASTKLVTPTGSFSFNAADANIVVPLDDDAPRRTPEDATPLDDDAPRRPLEDDAPQRPRRVEDTPRRAPTPPSSRAGATTPMDDGGPRRPADDDGPRRPPDDRSVTPRVCAQVSMARPQNSKPLSVRSTCGRPRVAAR